MIIGYKLAALWQWIKEHAFQVYVSLCILVGVILVLAVGCDIIVVTAW